MGEISSRPWGILHSRDATDSYRRYIEDAKGNRIASMYRKDFCDYCTCMPDADYIVKCVNEREVLVAEYNNMIDIVGELRARAEEAEAEVERLTLKLDYAESMQLHKNLEARAVKAEAQVKQLQNEISSHREGSRELSGLVNRVQDKLGRVNARVTEVEERAVKAEAELVEIKALLVKPRNEYCEAINAKTCKGCVIHKICVFIGDRTTEVKGRGGHEG